MYRECINESCIKQASYNYKFEKKRLYCFKHKLENMIDIHNKRCIFKDCKIRPTFNYENEKLALYCFEHKLENMIDIKSKRCIFKDCKIQPTFNYENEKIGLYCFKHKLENMIDIKHKKCIQCNLIRLSKKYNNYCVRCFIYLFPENNITRQYKTKEKFISDDINIHFNNIFINDKQVPNSCNIKRRPDLYTICDNFVLIIEIDENQHKNYDNTCEISRINELSIVFNHKQIRILRINCDKYENKSMFKIHKTLETVLKNDQIYNDRINLIILKIQHIINLKTINELMITEYIFYNN